MILCTKISSVPRLTCHRSTYATASFSIANHAWKDIHIIGNSLEIRLGNWTHIISTPWRTAELGWITPQETCFFHLLVDHEYILLGNSSHIAVYQPLGKRGIICQSPSWFSIKFRFMAVWMKPITRRAPWYAGTTCPGAHQLPEALHLVLLSVASEFPICFLQLVPEPLLTASGVQLLLLYLRWWSSMRSQVYLLIFCLLKYEFTSPWNNKNQWTSAS